MIRFREKFFISLFLASNFFGLFFYFFGGQAYLTPSFDALLIILFLSLSVASGWAVFCLTKPMSFVRQDLGKSELSGADFGFYFAFFLTAIFVYFNFFELSPIQKVFGMTEGEHSRPDVTGKIEYYWSFSVLVTSFIIPYLLQKTLSSSRFDACVTWIFLLIFYVALLGDKSTGAGILFFVIFLSFESGFLLAE